MNTIVVINRLGEKNDEFTICSYDRNTCLAAHDNRKHLYWNDKNIGSWETFTTDEDGYVITFHGTYVNLDTMFQTHDAMDVLRITTPSSSSSSSSWTRHPPGREGRLRAVIDEEESVSNVGAAILSEPTLKDAHVYCRINKLSGQVCGSHIEKYIIHHTPGLTRNSASQRIGDCTDEMGNNIEIKISLGHRKKFNYVQIRSNHDIQYYLLTAYYLDYSNYETGGELFTFRVPADDMKGLLKKFGSYAHGTVRVNGCLRDSIDEGADREYALRPMYGSECWKALLMFRLLFLT